ncbi:glucose 1-dehydrogenase [Candidatus Poriferisodalis sp.]|uniref:glucose 1-dehydrogenase n=1 Tax=Candidatus Poriferisodalis sp. TaxID=3101277 RepID=UPI003B012F36
MGRLDGKVAVITGGASGLGEGTVRRFVEEGARVVVADIQEAAARELVSSLGDATRFQRTDVTQEADVEAAVGAAVREFGRLDCMFNNAGIVGAVGSITQTSAEAWDESLSILLRGVFLGCKHAARVMIDQGSGAIISTSSVAGVVGGLGPHAYTAAKHGVIGLTKSVANELAQHGVRANAIAPGSIVTAMTASVISGDHTDTDTAQQHISGGSPLGFGGMPIDIANAALYLASDEARYLSGHCLVVDAGFTAAGAVPNRFHRGDGSVIGEAGRRG